MLTLVGCQNAQQGNVVTEPEVTTTEPASEEVTSSTAEPTTVATTSLTEETTEAITTEVTTTAEATTTTEATTTEITTTKEVTTSETTVEVDENGYPILEPLDSELEQEIINAYIDTLPDKVKNDPDFCGESVYIYYGTYDGYPVVAMNYHGAISSSLISQGVLDYWFDFPGEFLIQAYSDGKFEDISLIADNNEDAIAAML